MATGKSAALMAALLALIPARAFGQEMEPRAYSASPVGLNFAIASYLRTTGSVSLDPSLPITNVKASINTGLVGYDRTFDLFGRAASAAIVLPYIEGRLSGDVFGAGTLVTRSGLGDLRLRLTTNLYGNPALTPEAFAKRRPGTTLGASFTIVPPTGDYNPAHLANIGSNRWAFRPELGVSQPLGNWFADAAAGLWFFTDNPDFLLVHRRVQEPLWELQTHAGYNFRPGLWLSLDGAYATGGRTSIDGIQGHDTESASRYGMTLSVPIRDGFSAKLAFASWLTARNGGNYDTIGLTLQFRWFNP